MRPLSAKQKIVDDDKARRILFDTYWSSDGWKEIRSTPPKDLDYARKAGYMFDPVVINHDEIIRWATKARKQINLREVTQAFLASLSTRRLELRSALGSYAVARHLPAHSFTGSDHCDICEIEKAKLGVSGNDLRIAAIALEHGATVITRNVRDFELIPGLATEDWSQ